jgi:cellulose synthase/poly-beta-1,6-N-acetylglucosamine synthase-like glycosyltransferase
MLLIFFWAVLAAHVAQWVALRQGMLRAKRRSDDLLDTSGDVPISVVVAARNEREALPRLLEALVRQRHRPEAIIVIDDASTDGTAGIAREWRERHPHIRLVTVSDPQAPRKKNALTLGISVTPTDLIAFTDADCTPGPAWTEALARAAAVDRLLISHSPFRVDRGSVNFFSRYETFIAGYLSAAAAGLGRPYMAVGRNMCYARSLFDRVDGFEHSRDSLSGDDDLFVQHVHRLDAAEIVHIFAPGAFVPSDPPATWREWVRQKIRHTSAGRFYPTAIKVHLAAFQAANLLIWLSPVILGWTGALMLGIKLVVQGVILREGERLLNDRGYIRALPILDFGYALYNLLIAPIGLVRMPKRW